MAPAAENKKPLRSLARAFNLLQLFSGRAANQMRRWRIMSAPPTPSITVIAPQFISALASSAIVLPTGQAAHVLRHTFASHFMINGGNISTLQKNSATPRRQ
jgi:hypothetical protein